MKYLLAAMALVVAGKVAAQSPQIRVVDEDKLGAAGVSVVGHVPLASYPLEFAGANDDVCVAVGYTVNPDGSTGNYHLLRAWTSDRLRAETDPRYLQAFATAASEAVSHRRFGTAGMSAPVATTATVTFTGSGSARRLADRCRVSQLAVYYRTTGRQPLQSMDASRQLADVAIRLVHAREATYGRNTDLIQYVSRK